MASYYNSYEPRPRPSRSNETFPYNKDDPYLRPTTATKAAGESVGRDGERWNQAPRKDSGMSYTAPQSYSSRQTYLTPDALPRQMQAPPRRRSTYPPQPTCEDEVASLAKEAGSQTLLNNISKDEAVLRGSIDQEPIVEDAPKPPRSEVRDRVVKDPLRTSSASSSGSGIPTPPPSDDEQTRKANRRPSKLDLSFKDIKNDLPEFTKRTASPYAFSRSTGPANEPARDRFLSPESLLSPPPTDSRSRPHTHFISRSQPSSPVRETSKRGHSTTSGDDYFSISSGESALEDTDEDTNDSGSKVNRRRPYPPRLDVPTQSDVVDFAGQASTAPPRRLNLDARRNTSTGDNLPSFQRIQVDKTRKPTPLTMSNALSDLEEPNLFLSPTTTQSSAQMPPPPPRVPDHIRVKGVSPSRSATDPQGTTPPRTPRASLEIPAYPSADNSPTSRTSSVGGSASGSRPSSRPSSPSPRTPSEGGGLPKTELDWSTLLAANMARRSNGPARVSSLRQESLPTRQEFLPARQESLPTAPRVDSRPVPPVRNSSLPYPVDDGPLTPTAWMPSERHHQYFPETRPNLPTPSIKEAKTTSRVASPIPSSKPSSSSSSSTARPAYPARHSAIDLPTLEKQSRVEKPRFNESKRVSSFHDPSQAKKDAQALVEKGLPECPRNQPTTGKSDWYTLIGAPSLDFCPDCIDYMGRTVFRLSFRKSPPRSLDTKITCALGGDAWMRLAWLLTLHRKKSDLNYLKDIAEIEETTQCCPGNKYAAQTWYGLRDPDGLYVRNFHICYNDVKKIERLFPSLDGMFVPLPNRASYDKQLCAVRTVGNRFSTYLDALSLTHEKALTSRRGLDPLPFIKLVEKRQRLRECTRDTMMANQLWHYIPSIPDLTVCEDCFESIVEPKVKENAALALRFNRTVQPAYGETVGSSCQLYSARMRKIFHRAVEGNDVAYLARKARERREAEVRLQERYREVMRKFRRVSGEGGMVAEEERKVDREIRRITEEWQREWE